jgi:cytochrome c-type biogenesis protein CcmH/NrfG
MRSIGAILVVGAILVAGIPPAAAVPAGSPAADEAYGLCRAAERHTGETRETILVRGYELAREAVAADPRDARAQFAVFCTLGRRIQEGGLGLASPFEVFRALRALDAAVALDPEDPDLATAKGAMLASLPRVFGGDVAAAESWLRRALKRDPHQCTARWYLAEILSQRGEHAEAATLRAQW